MPTLVTVYDNLSELMAAATSLRPSDYPLDPSETPDMMAEGAWSVSDVIVEHPTAPSRWRSGGAGNVSHDIEITWVRRTNPHDQRGTYRKLVEDQDSLIEAMADSSAFWAKEVSPFFAATTITPGPTSEWLFAQFSFRLDHYIAIT